MKYLCLAYYDEKKFDALPKAELDAIVSQCQSRDEALRKSGHLLTVDVPGSGLTIRHARSWRLGLAV